MRSFSVLLSFLLFLAASADEPECGSGKSIRSLIGPAPLTNQLHAVAAKTDGLLFANGEFDEEKFTYIGEVHVSKDNYW